jgi:hypothetical protein
LPKLTNVRPKTETSSRFRKSRSDSGLPEDQLRELLAALNAQPIMTRERLLRRVVEAWLTDQRDHDRAQQHGD